MTSSCRDRTALFTLYSSTLLIWEVISRFIWTGSIWLYLDGSLFLTPLRSASLLGPLMALQTRSPARGMELLGNVNNLDGSLGFTRCNIQVVNVVN